MYCLYKPIHVTKIESIYMCSYLLHSNELIMYERLVQGFLLSSGQVLFYVCIIYLLTSTCGNVLQLLFSAMLATPPSVGCLSNTINCYSSFPCLPVEVTVEFTAETYTVQEDNETATVCLRTNFGILDPLIVMVTASTNTSCK